MKKCLLLALLCFSLLVYVYSLGAFPAAFLGSGGAPVAACSGNYGNTSTSAQEFPGVTAGEIACFRVSLACSGTVSSMSVFGQYFDGPNNDIEFNIYSDSGNEPNTPYGTTAGYGLKEYCGVGSTAAWCTDSSLDNNTISGDPTNVWLCVQVEGIGNDVRYNSGGSGAIRRATGTFGTWPATWPTATDTHVTGDMSIYATF